MTTLGHTSLRVGGWGESQFRRGAYTVVLFICTYFVPSALKREHPALQNSKFLPFFLFSWAYLPSWILNQIRIPHAYLDPDLADQNQCGSTRTRIPNAASYIHALSEVDVFCTSAFRLFFKLLKEARHLAFLPFDSSIIPLNATINIQC